MDKDPQNNLSKGSLPLPVTTEEVRPITPMGHKPTADQGDDDAKGIDTTKILSSEYHAKFADEVHQYIREYIRNADQKAAFFFTVSTTIFIFLRSKGVLSWMQSFLNWDCKSWLAFISTLGLMGCAGISLFVVFPRRSGSKRGVIFFDAIREHESGKDYSDDVLNISSEELVKAKLRHCYDISKICNKKYNWLYWAFLALAIGIGATILYLIFFVQNTG